MPAMALIDELLTTRLYAELRDKRGLAYVVNSSFIPRVGPSNIMAFMVTDPPKHQEARAGIVREFKRLQEEPVGPAELDAAKAAFRGSCIMSMETGIDRGRTLGIYELGKGDYGYADMILKASAEVRPKDIQRVAKNYFDHYALAVIAPQGSIEE
jgi:predicted Zn-dependent peptidase